jgi:hypothetical protein
MPFVLDASIAACWGFDDEDHLTAAPALERIRADEGRVPSLWWFEIRNTLIVNERRGRITEADTTAFLRGWVGSAWWSIGRPTKPSFSRSSAGIG